MTNVYYDYLDSPVGRLLLVADGQGLRHLAFERGRHPTPVDDDWQHKPGALRETRAQLKAYFAGKLREFDLPLAPQGTDFQRRVWRELLRIPYGATASYGDIARAVGEPNASRAVGAANGLNPIAIVVPCHRVIGANGTLTGYGGGLPNKKFLLELEQKNSAFALTP